MNISYKHIKDIPPSDIAALYNDANWTAYTKEMNKLMDGINGSLAVITAWQHNELLGLVRVIGDGQTIVYIQDIIVKHNAKRKGIGSSLVKMVLSEFNHVRQIVLLTDDNPESRGFYEALNFESCDKGTLVAFAKVQA